MPAASKSEPRLRAIGARIARLSLFTAIAGSVLVSCGVESRKDRQARAAGETPGRTQADTGATPSAPFEWPTSEGPRPTVSLNVRDHGEIRIALYPELAPRTVEAFLQRSSEGFYDDTTFHRVIPGFMIQGGDPNSRDDDPANDGMGGPVTALPDEFNRAPHIRGVVSMANRGPNTAGSQFFIVQSSAPHLDGRHTVFGRVVEGMDVVDSIATVETDALGRWGPKRRPLRDVVVESVAVLEVDAGSRQAAR